MTTSVSPGNVRSFAKYVQELADLWKPHKEAIKDAKDEDHDNFPRFGKAEGAEAGKQDYVTKLGKWEISVVALHDVLVGLKEAMDKIADQYESVEGLNDASSESVKSTLETEMAPEPATGTPPSSAA
jgi:hypothetical protein